LNFGRGDWHVVVAVSMVLADVNTSTPVKIGRWKHYMSYL